MEQETTILNLIKENNVITLFQPVVSLRDKRVIGFEALSRGICSNTGRVIKPLELFSMARSAGCDMELDNLCRKVALTSFKSIQNYNEYILFFLNLDTSVINNKDENSKIKTIELTDELGLDYSSISLEIVESKIDNEATLAEFVEHYRRLGYYVSLDDFGAMHSNMNRIVSSKPDIIKIDMDLIRNVSVNYYQQSIISSIIDLARKTGALTLAEGLETPEDIIKCYELGIDLYQGFISINLRRYILQFSVYLSKNRLSRAYDKKNRLKENVLIRKNQHSGFDFIVDLLIRDSEEKTFEEYNKYLQKHIKHFAEIERVFLLDETGQQTTESINNIGSISKKCKSFLKLYENHSDHSLKEYFFYYLGKIDSDKFYTDTYLSNATGRILRIMSVKVKLKSADYILCVEFVDSAADNYNLKKVGG